MSDSDSQFGSFRSALQSESPPLHSDDDTAAVTATSPVVVSNRSMREEMAATVAVVEGDFGGGGGVEDVAVEEEKRGRSRREGVEEIRGRGRGRGRRREVMVKRAELGIRVWEVIVCLISFSVMVTDRTRGWSGDSFDRYKEYRYCAAVSVIGFVYSGLQACHLCYDLITQKHAANFHHLRDFAMDQILAYLMISASSSAATRVDDWVSNWGKDQFANMATASIGMSFLAFAAFAISSLISGYNFCHQSATAA
ncbi:CASP-like protein 4A3 [Camellia lanceoleosa]|uniref:CASP-like protein 4A3 n=1 Tax=Camellia lanceoleosa TaxID=1840588 RepID=A0ACC0F8E4_9ERIC|nr:CASP-like protein 4A3 [Camellia lanceoleosa]